MSQDEVTEARADAIHQMIAQRLWAHMSDCERCQREGLMSTCPECVHLAEVKEQWLERKVQMQMIRDGYA